MTSMSSSFSFWLWKVLRYFCKSLFSVGVRNENVTLIRDDPNQYQLIIDWIFHFLEFQQLISLWSVEYTTSPMYKNNYYCFQWNRQIERRANATWRIKQEKMKLEIPSYQISFIYLLMYDCNDLCRKIDRFNTGFFIILFVRYCWHRPFIWI